MGIINIALPPSMMLPTNIAALTGHSILLSVKANATIATNTTHATMAAPHNEISDTNIILINKLLICISCANVRIIFEINNFYLNKNRRKRKSR